MVFDLMIKNNYYRVEVLGFKSYLIYKNENSEHLEMLKTIACRDHVVNLLFIWTDLLDFVDYLIAEAIATLLLTQKVYEIDLPSIIIETDSLLVIQAIQGIPTISL